MRSASNLDGTISGARNFGREFGHGAWNAENALALHPPRCCRLRCLSNCARGGALLGKHGGQGRRAGARQEDRPFRIHAQARQSGLVSKV